MTENSPNNRVANPAFIKAMQALQQSGTSPPHTDSGFWNGILEMGAVKAPAEPADDANNISSSYKITGKIVSIDDKATAAVSVLDLFNPVMPEDKIPLERLDLSTRTHNILKGAGINSLGDLLARRKELMSIRGIGRKSIEDIALNAPRFACGGSYAFWMEV